MKTLFTIALALGLTTAGFSQGIKTPRPSPNAMLKQDLGLGSVTITYSRPGVKERAIYGDLVPFGKVWRTGANATTNIEFTEDVQIEGNELKAGKYGIFTIPNKESWTIIFSNNTTASAPKYKEEEDALRIEVKPNELPENMETFTFLCSDIKDNSLNINLLWEKTKVSFNVSTNVDEKVMAAIEKTMAGPSASDFYRAASYYFNNEKNIDQAVEWIGKSVEMDAEKPKFWVIHLQAKILAKAGNKKEAIAAAERSLELAEKANYDAYIKKNKDLLKELGK